MGLANRKNDQMRPSARQDARSLTARRQIPTLDGLRAVSILCVIAGHVAAMESSVARFGRIGGLGVRVFFVISGYLITTLLRREWERRGTVSLRAFYFRRTLRIFPPFYVFLLVTAVLFALGAFPESRPRWWPALTYLSNLWSVGTWELGHTWSLAIEEQFYLVWPFAFRRLGPGRARWAAAIAIVTAPFVRFGARALGHATSIEFFNQLSATWTVDFLAVGCILALLPQGGRLEEFSRRALGSRSALAAALLIGLGQLSLPLAGRLWVGIDLAIAQSLLALVLGLTLAWCVSNPNSRLGRFLEAAPLRALGVASYSVYLWQQLFFRPTSRLSLPLAAIGTLAAAALSYFVVERPSLRVRSRLEKRWAAVLQAVPRPASTVASPGKPDAIGIAGTGRKEV